MLFGVLRTKPNTINMSERDKYYSIQETDLLRDIKCTKRTIAIFRDAVRDAEIRADKASRKLEEARHDMEEAQRVIRECKEELKEQKADLKKLRYSQCGNGDFEKKLCVDPDTEET